MSCDPQPTPLFPPELTDSIIGHINFHAPTLRACGLVCHAWVPASRHRLYESLSIRGDDIPRLLDLLDSQHNTIAGALRALDITFSENGPTSSLLARCTDFLRLEKISLRSSMLFKSDRFLPMPRITTIELGSVHFAVFRQFIDCVSQFPGLKNLKLGSIGWGEEFEYGSTTEISATGLPRLDLETLSIHFLNDPRFLLWLSSEASAPKTRVLVLDMPRDELTILMTDQLSEYLRQLNVHLQHLHIKSKIPLLFNEQVEFNTNTALRSIKLDHSLAFRRILYSKEGTIISGDLAVSSFLPSILRRFHSNCLENLIIGVSPHSSWGPTASVDELAASLNMPQYANIRRLQFSGTWESDAHSQIFTSNLLDRLPSSVKHLAALVGRY
ncbi:hypothetical protein C8R43DRAFT_1234262 [Mycena crocata]|nr:hypothetical protein C8R43DRAFT_1234262 [Mycena crocata]